MARDRPARHRPSNRGQAFRANRREAAMKLFAFPLLVIAMLSFVAGQFFFKDAMDHSHRSGFGADFYRFFIPGIASMTVSFFLPLGLLQHFDLSFVYPFQGLSVIIVTAAAA